jgi:hypothetical protein
MALEHKLWGTYINAIIDPCSGGYFECWPILATLKDSAVVTSYSHVVLPVHTCWTRDFFSEPVWTALERANIEF